ncbi:neuronal PAS domain-containing protein 4-like [Teleopsis dalmanni]|uniref:neuronal PAS domain-containing protein 4-like n=1 Tax=Teleopsis dalmanni TaxID=139649 RepID=UPI0018CD5034|nr:neuronal PAS domain-containing protein 4-like [Teleopsis dalmanni]
MTMPMNMFISNWNKHLTVLCVVLVQGHYLSFLPLCSRNEPVFLATCTPIAMPETRECVVQGATNVFTTIHSMDMKIAHIDKNGEFHLNYSRNEIQGLSWYNLIHSDNLREAQSKHRLITQSEQDRSCILLVRMQRRHGDFIWVHVVLQVRDSQDTNQQPVIVCTNQVLNEREASVMIANSWLYHYYSVQSKIHFGLPYEGTTRVPPTTPAVAAAAAAAVYYHHSAHHTHHHHHHSTNPLPATATPNSVAGVYPAMHHTHHHHHPHQQYHHMAPYVPYHTSAIAGSSNGTASPAHLVGQQHCNGINSTSNGLTNGSNGHQAPSSQYIYQHRLGPEPVDYSQVSSGSINSPPGNALSVNDMRCSSTNSSVSSHNTPTPTYAPHIATNNQSQNGQTHQRISSPPVKKRAIGKLEPLYLPDDSPDDSTRTINTELERPYLQQIHTGGAETHASVVFATVVPTRPRLLNKSLPNDPPDFIDQWNPSPPWSENAQKLSLDSSSSSQQELSPCITTTPPTPTSAPSNNIQTIGPAFSFEWVTDQLVPIVDPCLPHTHWTTASLPTTDAHHHLTQHLASHSHRLLNLTNSLNSNHETESTGTSSATAKKEIVDKGDKKGFLLAGEHTESHNVGVEPTKANFKECQIEKFQPLGRKGQKGNPIPVIKGNVNIRTQKA